MVMADFADVAAYLAALPEPARGVLTQVCLVIGRTVPEAESSISYKIPTWKVGGKMVIHCAAWEKHYALYPVSSGLLAAIGVETAGLDVEKGTIRFAYVQSVPVDLIARITKFRAESVKLSV